MTESTTIRWERGSDGIVLLTLDDPARPANTLSPDCVTSMRVVVDRLEEERDSIAGVVITSAKKTFFTGGDLLAAEPKQIDLRHAADIAAELNQVRAQLRRLEMLGRPVVAAINGAALGCGMEIALACHHSVAADAEGCLIGLPERTYGPMHGAGSNVRRGQLCTPIEALEVGLVQEVVETVDELVPRAKEWIRSTPEASTQPWDVVGDEWVGNWPDSLYAFDLAERLLATAPELPDEPTDEQVDAWLEYMTLIRDTTLRDHPPQIGWVSYTDPAGRESWMELAATTVDKAGTTLDAGVEPASDAATPVVDELVGLFSAEMDRADTVTFRRDLLTLLESANEPWATRYRQLVATITGRPPIATSSHAWRWFVDALRAHS